jgi:hypothetical protein
MSRTRVAAATVTMLVAQTAAAVPIRSCGAAAVSDVSGVSSVAVAHAAGSSCRLAGKAPGLALSSRLAFGQAARVMTGPAEHADLTTSDGRAAQERRSE